MTELIPEVLPSKEEERSAPFWDHVGELRDRLIGRAQDSASTVAKRMAKAADEISHWPEYDYVIVNNDIAKALGDVQAILNAERLKRTRQIGISDFAARLV